MWSTQPGNDKSLQEHVWYNTVVEGGRRFMDARRSIEEQASETRQEKGMEKETGNAFVVPKVAVGLTDYVRSHSL